MDHDDVLPGQHEGLLIEPVEEGVSVLGSGEGLEGAPVAPQLRVAALAQQVDVVVPEHRLGSEGACQAEAPHGVRAAVDEVPDGVESVRGGVVPQDLEQLLELLAAALEISDEDAAARHGGSLVGPPARPRP